MLKAIHASEDKAAAHEKATTVIKKLEAQKLRQAAAVVRKGIGDTLAYYDFPDAHWRRIRTNNPLERILREIRRRTRVVGAFPDGNSALMLVAEQASSHRRYALGNTSLSQHGSTKRGGERNSCGLNRITTAIKSAKDS
jgi:transposase-like protein